MGVGFPLVTGFLFGFVGDLVVLVGLDANTVVGNCVGDDVGCVGDCVGDENVGIRVGNSVGDSVGQTLVVGRLYVPYLEIEASNPLMHVNGQPLNAQSP